MDDVARNRRLLIITGLVFLVVLIGLPFVTRWFNGTATIKPDSDIAEVFLLDDDNPPEKVSDGEVTISPGPGTYTVLVRSGLAESLQTVEIERFSNQTVEVGFATLANPVNVFPRDASRIIQVGNEVVFLNPSDDSVNRVNPNTNVFGGYLPTFDLIQDVQWINPTNAVVTTTNGTLLALNNGRIDPLLLPPGVREEGRSVIRQAPKLSVNQQGAFILLVENAAYYYESTTDTEPSRLSGAYEDNGTVALGTTTAAYASPVEIGVHSNGRNDDVQPSQLITINTTTLEIDKVIQLDEEDSVFAMSWSPNGQTLLLSTEKGLFALFAGDEELTPIATSQTTIIGSMEWLDNDVLLVSGGRSLWELSLSQQQLRKRIASEGNLDIFNSIGVSGNTVYFGERGLNPGDSSNLKSFQLR